MRECRIICPGDVRLDTKHSMPVGRAATQAESRVDRDRAGGGMDNGGLLTVEGTSFGPCATAPLTSTDGSSPRDFFGAVGVCVVAAARGARPDQNHDKALLPSASAPVVSWLTVLVLHLSWLYTISQR
jgi:hypothetical protein